MPSANSARQAAWLAVLAGSLLSALALDDAIAQGAQVRLVVQSSPLAGFRHYEARAAWSELVEGMDLQLVREPLNPHDGNAIRVEWRGRMLGYVPRRENAVLAWGLDRGEPLRARISRLTQHANPARRIEFEVFIEGTRGRAE
jgi:hypothetical protein